jgi:hypothetical protein
MKPHRILGLYAVTLLARIALADEPAVSAQALGTTEATLDFCTQVDPRNADRYQAQIKILAQGASEKALAKVRKSDEYKQAYDSTTEMFAGIKQRDAVRTCTDSLVANQ